MTAKPPILDYYSPNAPTPRGRPRRLLSHCRTAAILCVVTLAFHVAVRGNRGLIVLLELALPIYGTTAAVWSLLVGRLVASDWRRLLWCGAIYLITLAWSVLAPSLNH